MPTKSSNPSKETIDETERLDLIERGTLIPSDQTRPLYFDGRFLKAADLISEQTYFLKRQATLNSANGFGVVRGLEVTQKVSGSGANRSEAAFEVKIAAGSGVTPNGESVVIESDFDVNLADATRIAMFDAALGIEEKTPDSANAEDPIRLQTGVFILGLRLVEYKTGSVPSYPTSNSGLATETIRTQKGEIVEAAAVTLVRYGNLGVNGVRSRIAGDIFSGKTIPQEPANLLPLAMVALEANAIKWVDNFLVRRELGNVASGPLGLRTLPRALRSAHLQQYNQQLSEELGEELGQSGSTRQSSGGFSAKSYFDLLPATGRLPKSAINTTDFSQTYFPAEISVQLTAVPTDEIAALVEDSLVLPPIDLRANAAELESLSLLLVIPMTRQALTSFKRSLTTAEQTPAPSPTPSIFQPTLPIRSTVLRRPIKLASPGLIAKRLPLEKLYALSRRRLAVLSPVNAVDNLWSTALNEASELWYVRQRNIPYQSEIIGTAVPLTGDDAAVESRVSDRIGELNLGSRFNDIQNNTGIFARGEVVSLLASPQISRSNLLLRSAIRDLEAVPTNEPSDSDSTESTARPIDRADVLRVAERFGDPRLGEGLSRLESIAPAIRENEAVVNILAESGDVVALDRVSRTLSPNELNTFSRELTNLAQGGNAAEVSSLIRNRLEVIR